MYHAKVHKPLFNSNFHYDYSYGTIFHTLQFFQSGRQADQSLANKMMNRFVELGGNFIDTANLYAIGESEKIIGNWLKL